MLTSLKNKQAKSVKIVDDRTILEANTRRAVGCVVSWVLEMIVMAGD